MRTEVHLPRRGDGARSGETPFTTLHEGDTPEENPSVDTLPLLLREIVDEVEVEIAYRCMPTLMIPMIFVVGDVSLPDRDGAVMADPLNALAQENPSKGDTQDESAGKEEISRDLTNQMMKDPTEDLTAKTNLRRGAVAAIEGNERDDGRNPTLHLLVDPFLTHKTTGPKLVL